MEIKSGFAVLDVKDGRDALRARLKAGTKIDVLIHATFEYADAGLGRQSAPGLGEGATIAWQPHSHDDGESQEFALDVHSVELAI